jgi:hypothetical protein
MTHFEYDTLEEAQAALKLINDTLGIPIDGNVTTTYCEIEEIEGKFCIVKDATTEAILGGDQEFEVEI